MNASAKPTAWRGPPLALQMMGLLIGGLVVAQLVTLMLTLLLPPAPTVQYGLDDIAAALRGAAPAAGRERNLQRLVQAGPPNLSGPGWLVSERSRRELAGLLEADADDVTLAFYTPLPFAGTAAAPGITLKADDGPIRPLAALAGSAAQPARLILAQAVVPPPAFPAPPPAGAPSARTPGAIPPGRDTLPPGLGPGTAPTPGGGLGLRGAPPGASRSGDTPDMRPLPLRPGSLFAVDPTLPPGNGLLIPGDGGAAVPALLRGNSDAAQSAGGELRARPANPIVPGGPFDAGRPPPGTPRPFQVPARLPPLDPPSQRPAVAPPTLLTPPAEAGPRRTPPPGVAAPASAPLSPSIAHSSDQAPDAVTRTTPMPEDAGGSIAQTSPAIAVAPPPRGLFGLAPAPFVEGDFVAAFRLADARWVVVQPAPEPFPNAWQRRVLLWFAIALAIVAPFGWLFARRLVEPLGQFAGAAERLGRDPAAPVMAVDGPAELGRATHAFNLMQTRLRAFVADRTAMIGAISHDLRTPLTRMRFRVEDVPDEVREGLLEEVEEMERMITSVLEFIRDASSPGARERIDLRTLVDDVVEDALLIGSDVTLEERQSVMVEVDVLGMRRVLDNLLQNAAKYGGRAHVRLTSEDGYALAEIIDEGRGLPEHEMERVFEPFYRSESARSSGKAGHGLGLAVCRSIARAHGGDVGFVRSSEGFRAQVRLPLAYRGS